MTTTTTTITKAKVTPNLPADLREELSADALSIKDRIGAPSGDYIGVTRDKTFRLPGVDKEAKELRAIVVDWAAFNQFYEGKFDPKNIKPPVCASLGIVLKELKPLENAPKPQHAECETCPNNQWGSDGGKGRACKNQRLLAILPPDDPENGPLALLKVSPTGIKHFDKYVNTIANSTLPVPHPIAFITRIYFDENSDYASLRFEQDGMNEQLEISARRRKEARTRLLTPPDMGGKPAA